MPKKLNDKQQAKLSRMKISPQKRGAMIRHSQAKNRSEGHNDEMLRQLARGKSVSEAHKLAVKKVGL